MNALTLPIPAPARFLRVVPNGEPTNLLPFVPEPKLAAKLNLAPKNKRYGVYAGSFNPFHKGHLNIAFKASALFDEVEIVQGWNPEKEKPKCDLSTLRSLDRFKTGVCDGLLTDYISDNYIGCDVTLVRGLRNSLDLQAEINLARYYTDLMPELKIIYLICDREYEHVSSSAIRTLALFGKEKEYIVT